MAYHPEDTRRNATSTDWQLAREMGDGVLIRLVETMTAEEREAFAVEMEEDGAMHTARRVRMSRCLESKHE